MSYLFYYEHIFFDCLLIVVLIDTNQDYNPNKSTLNDKTIKHKISMIFI